MQQQRDKRDKLQRASVACFGSVRARALRGWRGVAARQQKMRVALQGHKVSGLHMLRCRVCERAAMGSSARVLGPGFWALGRPAGLLRLL